MKNSEEDLPSLDTLDRHIEQVKQASERQKPKMQVSQGKAVALRSGTELMAGVGVGAFIGYQLDAWLNTRPWFLIILIFLGFAGGVMNMYRAVLKDSKILPGDKPGEANPASGADVKSSVRHEDERAGE